jgi:hypothetical protein
MNAVTPPLRRKGGAFVRSNEHHTFGRSYAYAVSRKWRPQHASCAEIHLAFPWPRCLDNLDGAEPRG